VNENRLTEVEVRYSYMERLLEDLSHVLRYQQRAIDALTTRLDRAEALLGEVLEDPRLALPHEKPPHY
jgi:uncharacterized coiled-coil protein SlyX